MESLPFPGNPRFRYETLRPTGRHIAYGSADFGEGDRAGRHGERVAAGAARAA
ncbi:hypothetical protein [Streptomyces erythrochromogenes]|uniref:hypothetical protein n=1 Tax=Streptomyces erythrochromogenes TaxID=285574 RepID=UPI00386DEE17|nr:hypothetical protein OG489_00890 [Streptomyces erythrochromogenes]WSR88197.1 hypothetical protein OG489_39070 [Streptomyces erythrochromogenes]